MQKDKKLHGFEWPRKILLFYYHLWVKPNFEGKERGTSLWFNFLPDVRSIVLAPYHMVELDTLLDFRTKKEKHCSYMSMAVENLLFCFSFLFSDSGLDLLLHFPPVVWLIDERLVLYLFFFGNHSHVHEPNTHLDFLNL